MSIEEINLFKIEEALENSKGDFIQYNLSIKSEESGKNVTLEGRFLEAQYKVDGGYVLFTTEGTIFDDMLYVNLIDSEFNLLETICLGTIYTYCILKNLQTTQPNKITFSFFGDDDRWQITIYKKPRFFFYKTSFLTKFYLIYRTKPFFQRSRLDITELA